MGTLESLGQLGRHPRHIRTYRTFRSKVWHLTATNGVVYRLLLHQRGCCWISLFHITFLPLCIVSATPLAVTTVQVLQEWTSIQDYIQWKVFEWPFSIAQGTCYPSIVSAFCYHHGACMSAYTSWRVSHVMLLLAYRWKQKHHSSSETP